MSVLYQSLLRRQITEEIYRKPTFELQLEKTTYRGIIKQQKKMGKQLSRAMVHGVLLEDMHTYSASLHDQLQAYLRDHAGRSDVFLQIGSANLLQHAYTTNQSISLAEQLTHLHSDLLDRYDLRPTVREHMPHATIVLSTDGSTDMHYKRCSAGGRRMINKAARAGLEFVVAERQDREPFWQTRYSMSYDKGFTIVPCEQFLALMDFLRAQDAGQLFLAKKGTTIVSGSLCLWIDDQLIYLYGATDRSFGPIGAHYWLTVQLLQRAQDAGKTSFDLLGIAPPGAGEDHPLAGVTRFKQSFGGTTIVYAGSYDLIINKLLYHVFGLLRGK